MARHGFYVVGIEPGTAPPVGRAKLREEGNLPMIDGLEAREVRIDYHILDSEEEIEAIRGESGI